MSYDMSIENLITSQYYIYGFLHARTYTKIKTEIVRQKRKKKINESPRVIYRGT
jgi:hypothetical protein